MDNPSYSIRHTDGLDIVDLFASAFDVSEVNYGVGWRTGLNFGKISSSRALEVGFDICVACVCASNSNLDLPVAIRIRSFLGHTCREHSLRVGWCGTSQALFHVVVFLLISFLFANCHDADSCLSG